MIWKSIPGFEGIYEASDAGLVKSVERMIDTTNPKYKSGKQPIREKILRPSKSGNIVLRKERSNFYFKIAQLILLTHKGPPPSKAEANARHLDDNPANNSIDNLSWGTHKDNHDDGVRNKRHARKGTSEALKYGEKLRGRKWPNRRTRRIDLELLKTQAKMRQRDSNGRFT